MASGTDPNPSVFFNVIEIDVVKDSGGLSSPDHTKMLIVNFGCCVARTRGRGLFALYVGGRQDPRLCRYVEDEHIVKELMKVAAAKHVKTAFRPLLGEVNERMTGAWRGYGHGSLFIIGHLVPAHLLKIEIVHVIVELGQVGAPKDPHLVFLIARLHKLVRMG